MIEFDGVGVDFGSESALGDVSLTVPEGEFLAVVGPNGAGKTTLLRTANGLLSPDRGSVRVDGVDVASSSARRISRLVATVPQETSIAFEFDVSNIVAMGRTPHRARFEPADSGDREAVRSALERTDTAQFADRSVDELSGGERQRVVIARALAQGTPALLLDEPTASLDINHQMKTLALAEELSAEGRAVVAAIHDLELAARFCDRMALLSAGKLVAEGPAGAVLTPDRIEATFGVRVAVTTNPVTGTPTVTPLSTASPRESRVHVLGTGEGTARVIGDLVGLGISVTVGVVPEGDIAALTARGLTRKLVTTPAFGSTPEDRIAAAADLITTADATVVVGSPEGPNATLEALSESTVAVGGTNASAIEGLTEGKRRELLALLETVPGELTTR